MHLNHCLFAYKYSNNNNDNSPKCCCINIYMQIDQIYFSLPMQLTHSPTTERELVSTWETDGDHIEEHDKHLSFFSIVFSSVLPIHSHFIHFLLIQVMNKRITYRATVHIVWIVCVLCNVYECTWDKKQPEQVIVEIEELLRLN